MPQSKAQRALFALLANWLKLVCFNFPFAWFTQVFFIQPFIRVIFKTLFAGKKAREKEENVLKQGEIG